MKSLFITAFALLLLANSANAIDKNAKIQRDAFGYFDIQNNFTSNFHFFTTNYGLLVTRNHIDSESSRWPLFVNNQYLYGAGFWFGAQKLDTASNSYRKMVLVSYNPNNARSWFKPGRIDDIGQDSISLTDKNRVYFSTDFQTNGQVWKSEDGPSWPLWITDTTLKYQYGTFKNEFINDTNKRNESNFPLGPLFVSDEDIYSSFNDSDLSRYDGGVSQRAAQGYPLLVQVDASIYTWGAGEMNDVIIVNYLLENKSENSYKDCWFSGIYDVDIKPSDATLAASKNDRAKLITNSSDMNIAAAWTEAGNEEIGKGFGYVGVSILESPALDANNDIRTDKLIFEPSEQLGLTSFKSWEIADDPVKTLKRYDLISDISNVSDSIPQDIRLSVSSGPFNFHPGDKARLAYAIIFAQPAKGGEADGTYEDMAGFDEANDKNPNPASQSRSLLEKLKLTYKNYYNDMIMSIREKEQNAFASNVYPNPSNNMAILDYTLKSDEHISISILDTKGNIVASIFDGFKIAASYHHFIDLTEYNLTSAMYFIKIESKSQVDIRKLVIAK